MQIGICYVSCRACKRCKENKSRIANLQISCIYYVIYRFKYGSTCLMITRVQGFYHWLCLLVFTIFFLFSLFWNEMDQINKETQKVDRFFLESHVQQFDDLVDETRREAIQIMKIEFPKKLVVLNEMAEVLFEE